MAIRSLLPDADFLRKLFTYNPETGEIRHAVRGADMFSTKRAWAISKTKNRDGKIATSRSRSRLRVSISRKTYCAHRVAWKLHYGVEPPSTVDHINGNPHDNRIENLREATHSQNLVNSKIRSNNSTGITGVHFDKSRCLYVAFVNINKKTKTLGRFKTMEEAAKVRQESAIRHYGEFARL